MMYTILQSCGHLQSDQASYFGTWSNHAALCSPDFKNLFYTRPENEKQSLY